MYRDAAATATPRSTSRTSSSICLASSHPSAIVTTTTGAVAASMPNLMALAGPRPCVLTRHLSRRDGRVIGRVDDHQHFRRQPDRLEQPVKDADDLLALVVGGYHHRDAR